MRTILTAGNWKMNCTIDEAVQLSTSLRESLNAVMGGEVAVCPPFLALQAVKDVLHGTSIRLGAQDAFYEDSGAYTGAISAAMLAGLCEYVIVGHSERRRLFGDDDEIVKKKVGALKQHGITPILCVGETLEEFEEGLTAKVLERQMMTVLQAVKPTVDLVVAYEPVWAIGTGKSANPESVNKTVARIRALIGEAWGMQLASGIRILYGGSVTADNVEAFVGQDEIDGTLVGGASLKPGEFSDIVFRSAEVRR